MVRIDLTSEAHSVAQIAFAKDFIALYGEYCCLCSLSLSVQVGVAIFIFLRKAGEPFLQLSRYTRDQNDGKSYADTSTHCGPFVFPLSLRNRDNEPISTELMSIGV